MSIAAEKARLQQAKSISWMERQVEEKLGYIRAFREPALKVCLLSIQVGSVYSSYSFGLLYGGDDAGQATFFSCLFTFFAVLNILLFINLMDGAKSLGTLALSVLLIIPLTLLDGVAVIGYSMSASPPDRLTRGYNESKQLIRNVTFSDGMLLKAQKNEMKRYPDKQVIGQSEALANQEAANSALAIKRESLSAQGVEIVMPPEIMFYAMAEVVGIKALILKGWFSWLVGAALPWVTLMGGMYAAALALIKKIRRRTAAIEYSALLKLEREDRDERYNEEFDEFIEEDEIEKPQPGGSFIRPVVVTKPEIVTDFSSADEETSEAKKEYEEVKRRILQLEIPKPSIREIAGCRIDGEIIGKKHAEKIHARLVYFRVIIRDKDAATNSPFKANRHKKGHKHYIEPKEAA